MGGEERERVSERQTTEVCIFMLQISMFYGVFIYLYLCCCSYGDLRRSIVRKTSLNGLSMFLYPPQVASRLVVAVTCLEKNKTENNSQPIFVILCRVKSWP